MKKLPLVKIALGIVAVAVFVIAAEALFLFNQSVSQKALEQQTLLKAKKQAEEKSVRLQSENLKKEAEIIAFSQKVAADPQAKKAALHDVSGGTGSGNAFILRNNNLFSFSATVMLPELPAKTFYEGWVSTVGVSSFQYVDVGKLRHTSDGSYIVTFVGKDTLDGKDTVTITQERVDDQKPEKHILEGTTP